METLLKLNFYCDTVWSTLQDKELGFQGTLHICEMCPISCHFQNRSHIREQVSSGFGRCPLQFPWWAADCFPFPWVITQKRVLSIHPTHVHVKRFFFLLSSLVCIFKLCGNVYNLPCAFPFSNHDILLLFLLYSVFSLRHLMASLLGQPAKFQ